MMKYSKIAACLMTTAMLTGCGNTANVDGLIASQEETFAVMTEATVPPPPTDPSFVPFDASNGEYDVDLTILESNMVYAQCYDMVFNPDAYTGQKIRARGPFAYYQDEETGKEYFAVLISDATACCSQGIEFVLDGEYHYPDDYPETGTEITVVGTYHNYEDNGTPYVQLQNAVIEAQ
ncbi:MAG: hypothetical protein K6F80_04065 [Oscillospiraceae bacterium]|nr:hypothetical protein [Oscillospiraceae bacterium]